jgi:Mrp family chromosome partitioning ATPase
LSADQAFANLMRDKKLGIPTARAALPASEPSFDPRPAPSRAVAAGEFPEPPEPDYLPPETPGRMEPVVSSHPTETDVKPVGDLDTQIFDELPAARDDEASTPTAVSAADSGKIDLGRVRRIKRFNYLPLGGAMEFEVQSMDLAARLSARNPGQPSLLISSARRGEGRTELAIRFALALARRVGTRMLLADFDLRRPQVAPRLGISAKYFTLTDVLRGACPVEEALTVSDEDGLYVLPARASDRIGDEIVDARNFGAFMETIHRSFDYAVFDCPPAEHTDTLNLCRYAGAALFSGYSGATSARRLNFAAQRLAATGIEVAGMVLMGE